MGPLPDSFLNHFPERGLKQYVVIHEGGAVFGFPKPLPREGIETIRVNSDLIFAPGTTFLNHFPKRGIESDAEIFQ